MCVPARGRITPTRALVVGEAPGSNEDRVGCPFIGKAGKILDHALAEAFVSKFAPNEVVITNVVKCRPPGNRDPLPDEIDACFRYLNAEVRVVDPIAILCLGNVAAGVLLGETGISKIRGTWHHIRRDPPVPVMPTFHPAYVSYQGGVGSEAWDTFYSDVCAFAGRVIALYGEGGT